MKTLTFILSILVLISFFTSCDIIEPPFTTGNDIDTTTGQAQQKVLVEYFTGHRCPNCPSEAYMLKQMKQQYGERLIFISVHSGFFAEPLPSGDYTADYRTTTGNELDAAFGVTAISTPNALINRTVYETNLVIPPASWASAIAEYLLRIPLAVIYMETSLQGNTIHVNSGVKPKFQIDGTYMISTYIVEDSIISHQKNNNPEIGTTPDIADYAHRYMLRGSMNGTFGDTLFSPVAMPTDSFTSTYTVTADPAWNTSKLYAVCFIYNKDTDEVIQVEMKKIQ